MADYVKLAIDAGAKIIGGCCGTSAEHLAAMRKSIDTHVKGARPTHEAVIAATGELINPISTAKVSSGEANPAGRRRGGRRR